MPDLPDKEGRPIPFEVQILSYLIWTAPERGLTLRGYRKVFRRVAAHFGVRVGFWSTQFFTRNTVRTGKATRGWIRAEYHLDDDQMDRRQITVFQEGLRGTGFDKMDRVRERAANGTPFHKMGPLTCDAESLFNELGRIDLTEMMRHGERGKTTCQIPPEPLDQILRRLDADKEAFAAERRQPAPTTSEHA
jgi:hypothetical protein